VQTHDILAKLLPRGADVASPLPFFFFSSVGTPNPAKETIVELTHADVEITSDGLHVMEYYHRVATSFWDAHSRVGSVIYTEKSGAQASASNEWKVVMDSLSAKCLSNDSKTTMGVEGSGVSYGVRTDPQERVKTVCAVTALQVHDGSQRIVLDGSGPSWLSWTFVQSLSSLHWSNETFNPLSSTELT
jgi:hypothetical protein